MSFVFSMPFENHSEVAPEKGVAELFLIFDRVLKESVARQRNSSSSF
jgi:hypothetical protein|tara:strand:+ start:2156 stop:2296 length:141 start_codon:yes stop_codon:yes gene_type:complete